jgi:adenylosuccinate synthase
MPVTAVVGGHWGDEGKGKVVDALAAEHDLVIRYNGGANAGHTIVDERGTFRLHLVPSGVLHPNVTCLIGPGTVVNPDVLIDELRSLDEQGISTHNVFISNRAQLLFPHHITLDVLEEQSRGKGQHGTTKQGIWPAYADKVSRTGVRAGDLLHEAHLIAQVRYQASRVGRLMTGVYGHQALDIDAVVAQCRRWREALGPRIVDSHPLVHRALRSGARILLEGHLGVMRDLDWGIYPFVTSSTCLPGGAAAGAGVPAREIARVVGVFKAYTTAVGSGPMPTELLDDTGRQLRDLGQEFGTTTGRPRRCGWFDGVAARYAAEVAGFTELAIMKLDVLSGLETVNICTAYRFRGETLDAMPETVTLAEVEPVYETMPGWRLPDRVTTIDALPASARHFLDRIAALTETPLTMIGVGRDREALLRDAAASGAGAWR